MGAYYEYIEWFHICFLIIRLSSEPSTHHEFKWYHIRSKSLKFSDSYSQVLIKDLYLPAEISLRSESLQILIAYICAYTC